MKHYMNVHTYSNGATIRLQEETLTDNSKVYNLIITSNNHRIELPCTDIHHARRLENELAQTMEIIID